MRPWRLKKAWKSGDFGQLWDEMPIEAKQDVRGARQPRWGYGFLSSIVLTSTVALALYLLEDGLDPELACNEQGHDELAVRTIGYAASIGLEGIDQLDREGSIVREIAARLLTALHRRQLCWPTTDGELNPSTMAYAVALSLYLLDHGLDRRLGRNRLAQRVIEHAQGVDLDYADELDGAGAVMREMAARLLDETRKRSWPLVMPSPPHINGFRLSLTSGRG
jgi:hypothetical protein